MSHTQPPHAAYYSTGGPAAGQPRDLTALGVLAFVSAAVATACTCASAVVLGRAARIRAEEGLDALDWSLAVYYAGAALAAISLVAGWVTGSLWLHRARANAVALDPDRPQSLGGGWAWGGWLTPVLALWFPLKMVRDVRRATTPRGSTGLLGFWWALFLATEVGLWASFNLQGDALARFENAATAHQMSVMTAAVMVAALAGWGEVLRAVTTEQHARMYAGPAAQNMTVENRADSRNPTRS
jgi:hypothetical protein